MFMTKREEEDKLTVRLTLFRENLQPKRRPNPGKGPPEPPKEVVEDSAISVVPVCYSTTMPPPRSRQLNKESSVSSAKMLLRRHPHVPKRNPNVHEFFKAIYQAKMADIRYFLRIVSIRSVDPQDGRTPLMATCHIEGDRQRREVFNFLASHGAELGGRDEVFGRDLIGWAALLGRHEQLSAAINDTTEEINYQEKDATGCTRLHLAVMSGSLPTVDLVLDSMRKLGVDVDLLDSEGITPYILSRKLGYTRVSQLLQEKGRASAHQRDAVSFRSPTEWSAIGRRERLLQKQSLFQRGNWGVLPLTEEDISELNATPQALERGETFAERAMLSLAPRTGKNSQQLVHAAFDMWSEQNMPSYRRGAAVATSKEQPLAGKQAAKSVKQKVKRHKPVK